MKCFLILYVAFMCSLYWTLAAPVENSPGVQFLKYKDDKDFEEIQRQIIARYEQLGGSSQVHGVQTTKFVDPTNFKIHL